MCAQKHACATGSSDGSIRLWGGVGGDLMTEGPSGFHLVAEVAATDGQAPTCMDMALGVPDKGVSTEG